MKREAMIQIARMILNVSLITIGLGLISWSGVFAADQVDAPDGVVLVHLQYEAGQWQLGDNRVRILPCEPPNDFKRGSAQDPLVRVLGEGGKPLYEKNIRNPRLILYEDPHMKAGLLEKVSFNLRFAFRKGMQVFEFYRAGDSKSRQDGPVVKIDLREALIRFDEIVKKDDWLPCQQPKLK